MSNTKIAMCPQCDGRRMILQRTDKRGVPVAYFFRCSDCQHETAKAPTLKTVAELVQWVPLDAVVDA